MCAAAPGLSRTHIPTAEAQRAGTGAGQVGHPDAGAVPELWSAERTPDLGPRRGRKDKETPAQQKEREHR